MKESQIVTTYGFPKVGKTTDLGYSFPTGVFFAPSASSLLPLRNLVGIKPKAAVVESLHPVLAYVREHATDESIPSIVVDDIALLSERSVALWKQEQAGWFAYQRMQEAAIELCTIARVAPWHLVLDSHARPPDTNDNGFFIKGGPILPGRKAGPELEKNSSMILRAEIGDANDSDSGADESWASVYICNPADANWTTGDRNGAALVSNPMNLREILHASGESLPRVFDWQEEYVEKLSELAIAGKLTDSVLQNAVEKIAKLSKGSESARDWTFRDARARTFFKKHKSRRSLGVYNALLGMNRATP